MIINCVKYHLWDLNAISGRTFSIDNLPLNHVIATGFYYSCLDYKLVKVFGSGKKNVTVEFGIYLLSDDVGEWRKLNRNNQQSEKK